MTKAKLFETMMIKQILYATHRLRGTILSILFLMWFLSGFVLIYHTFPKVNEKDRNKQMDVLHGYMPSIDSVLGNISTDRAATRLSLKSFSGTPYFEVKSSGGVSLILSDSTSGAISAPTYPQIERYARQWCQSEIVSVDTLHELDQWIPFGYLKKDLPIYKFHFADNEKHQLYISSLSGEALQFTTKSSRMWAWLGAIPHWVYFTSLRQNTDRWVNTIIVLSGLGCVMCISGMVLGIRSYIVGYRKKKKLGTPYKKLVYKWHHILGFVFGIFVFTFVFSGMMSVVSIPQWMVKVNNPTIEEELNKTNRIDVQNYALDYRNVVRAYPKQTKRIEWGAFGNIPLYNVIVDNRLITIDASGDTVKILQLDPKTVLNRLAHLHTDSMRIALMNEYDNYYVGLTNHLPLPVFKVEVDDADKSTYYVNPKNGSIRYFNTNTKVHKWTYQGLHSFKFKFLAERPILWNSVMWITMIGGTLVSLSGVWLAFSYIRRRRRRRRRRRKTKTKKNKNCSK